MKSMKKLMEEMGFNPDASFEAKKAFIKHLMREAQEQESLRRPRDGQLRIVEAEPIAGEQLSLFPKASSDPS